MGRGVLPYVLFMFTVNLSRQEKMRLSGKMHISEQVAFAYNITQNLF